MVTVTQLVQQFQKSYWTQTPLQLKLIDAYLVAIMLQGVLQFIYCLAISSFPYNAFLAGFGAAVASFVFTASLRIQVNPKNTEYSHQAPERAFAEFLVCQLTLFFIVTNYIG
ncbi:oligosaccharyltransferase complex subunit epsilon [Dimargaris cristalligena]|uniref:Dolichyl-diphosphooligosaccharide--protein glycosyltransferase subunit OST2 n=1 Tax=Dimargaris cristalligena TaxID=215637 RepID=A0A4V1J5C7_9FUNG|nr:oligosaccharyltransferase complex subunit epsilon [Dimargaris cristalligena]RKP38599.1 Dolichyl-diphosphooligosaccharide--protein glycosyltransferase subunit dad1 [Dimargaris cristalligena]|eukprot:RKP38599.1 Dolichyl-diphosphooligosaccharide--protein glycosyltransferase subunit dad1 [Dimargaris cristalligena]